MYWVRNTDDSFEVMNGQQRTISILEYLKSKGSYSINEIYFRSLNEEAKRKILDYELMIYICEGEYEEKLNWFKIINIAGEKLKDQELRNALFTGTWLSDAKKMFSRKSCAAYNIGNKYISGIPINQDFLETALSWIIDENKNSSIENYMFFHQHDNDAQELWTYYLGVINWIETYFIQYRKNIMQGLNWGLLFNSYKNKKLNPNEIEKKIKELEKDDEVTNKKGIIPYILSGKENTLNLRNFKDEDGDYMYIEQKGICKICGDHFERQEMQMDHIMPWTRGGKTELENLQMLCEYCNKTKSSK